MESLIMLLIVAYFFTIFLISRMAGGSGFETSSFFTGDKSSKWYVVAGGMISASISGISIVSVPGMVGSSGFTYLQMVLGFFFGYLVIAYVLLPLYYRLNLTSIYGYLELRYGLHAHKVGAMFFILFKIVAATSRLYVVLIVLQYYIFDKWNIPFMVSASVLILFIFIYTFRSGIKALVWTDFFQTACLVVSLVLLLWSVAQHLNMDFNTMVSTIYDRPESKMFVFDDFYSRQNFFKQFLSGIFVVIVMTGLDQDVMQKNLTCKNLHESRKNMLSYGICFVPVNLILMCLGVLLLILAERENISLPDTPDHILPFFAMNYFGGAVSIFFIIALISAAFSSADSALVSLTTSVSVDMLGLDDKKLSFRRRMVIHFFLCILFIFVIFLFRLINSQSALDSIYTIVSYLYGPLLGMFAFGIFTKYAVRDSLVPYVAIISPVLCFMISWYVSSVFSYKFGYELLLMNGLLTMLGLYLTRRRGEMVPEI